MMYFISRQNCRRGNMTMSHESLVDSLLKLSPEDFFTRERMIECGIALPQVRFSHRRIISCCMTDSTTLGRDPVKNMREFLERWPTKFELMREPNMGEKIATTIFTVIQKTGLQRVH